VPAGDPAARVAAHPHPLLLADGVRVEVVFERLGHVGATIALTVFLPVHPGMGRGGGPLRGAAGGLTGQWSTTGCPEAGPSLGRAGTPGS